MIGNVFKRDAKGDENMQARAEIVRMAQQLGVGQYGSQLCPQCGGGSSKERSLSLAVETNGVIKFYCHRAACGFQGNAYATPGSVPVVGDSRAAATSHLNPLNADLYPLSEAERICGASSHCGACSHEQSSQQTAVRAADG